MYKESLSPPLAFTARMWCLSRDERHQPPWPDRTRAHAAPARTRTGAVARLADPCTSPWILMLLLALGGVTFTVPVGYWMVLTPVFAIICIAAGWRHVVTRQERLRLVITQLLNWAL